MSTTIEQLELEVQSSATSAVSGIDALASSLDKLKSAVKGGVGLTAVAKQLTTLNTALNGVSGANADNLNKLAQGLQTLSSIGNLKLSPSVATQITNIGNAVKSLTGTDSSVLRDLASALTPLASIGKANLNSFISQLQRLPQAVQALNSVSIGSLSSQIRELISALTPLTQMGKNNLSSFVTQLKKLPEAVAALQSVNIGALASQIQQLANAFAPLATQMQSIANGFSALPTRLQRLIQQTNKLSAANSKASMSYVNLAAKVGMAYVALGRIARVVGSWIAKSNDYQESLNLFTVSMGKYANEAKAYAEKVSELMGIDPAEWLKQQGTFMNLATGFGVAAEKAALMSKNLTQLGYDMASFFNMSIEDSMQKLQSAVAGELEPVRRVGYDLSQAALKKIALDSDNYAGSMENVANAMSDTAMSSFALSEGIKVSYNDMTQAEKSQLRYIALMKQITTVQGDMARTLETPANQLRILKAQINQAARSLGNIFIPMLNAVLPYAIALAKVIRLVADAIARLFGFVLTEIDYSGLDSAVDGSGKIEDNLGGAADEAKKVKNALLGIDELNIISPLESSGGGSGAGAGGGSLDFELPTYNFIDNAVSGKVDEILGKIKEWLGLTEEITSWSDLLNTRLGKILTSVIAIGLGFASWKLAKGLIVALNWLLSNMKGLDLLVSIGFKITGLALFLDSWNTMKEAIQDIIQNGANLTNVTKLLSGFAEGVGAAFLLLGKVKYGGAALIISGVAGIISDISDMVKNGVNWENATSLTKNLGLFLSGIGLVFSKDFKLTGIGLTISGLSLILQNLKDLINGFTTGDFENVDWIEVASGALMLIGGLILAFKKIGEVKDTLNAPKAVKALTTVSDTTSTLSTTVSTNLSPKLKSLAKNLGLGLVIVVEVAAAALLITGAIILLGKGLEQVGIAWQPVIDNGSTVALAMGIGVGILAVIGVVTALLGSIGKSLIVNLALGIAMLALLGVSAGLFLAEIWAIGKALDEIGKAWQPVLDNGGLIITAIGIGTGILIGIGIVAALLGVATVASAGLLPLAIGLGTALLLELGVATGLFLVEIWAVGKGLDEIGKAWKPVLDNGETIIAGISLGTALLIGIGVVTAALGVATVASAGLLPLAIGLGTALLVELAAAFVLFCESLVDTADELGNNLAPALKDLNGKLPTLSDNMSDFVDFMTDFADEVVRYTKVSAIAGLSATIDTIIGWFTQDPVEKLADDVENIYDQTTILNEKLNLAVPELKTAIDLLKQYKGFLTEMETLCNSNVELSTGMFVNMKEVGQKLVTGFVDGIKSKSSDFSNAAKTLVDGFKNSLNTNTATCKSSFISWASNLKNWFTSSSFGAINRTTFGNYAKDIVSGFGTGVTNSYSSSKFGMTTWASNVKEWFNEYVSYSAFYNIAKDVIKGFNKGINDYYDTTLPYMRTWARAAEAAYKGELDSNSPSKVFMRIGKDTVLGYNLGIAALGDTTEGVVTDWAKSFTSVSPVMSFAVDTSALKYYSSDDFAKSVSVNAVSSNRYTVDTGLTTEGLKEVMLEALNDSRIAEDMRRQADKQEQTIVQIGNRTVSDAVTTQRKANGYVFAR